MGMSFANIHLHKHNNCNIQTLCEYLYKEMQAKQYTQTTDRDNADVMGRVPIRSMMIRVVYGHINLVITQFIQDYVTKQYMQVHGSITITNILPDRGSIT